MERKMQRAMVPFFQKAVRSIVADLKVPDSASREQAERAIESAFDQEKLDKLLADTAGPVLADGFVEGAQAERMLVAAAMRRRRSLESQTGKASSASDALGDFDEDDIDDLDIPTEYPDWLREAAQDFVLRSFRMDYWQRINQTTRDDILGTLWRAIEDGLSIRDIATRIMEQHGAQYSRSRATNVARTEMTASMSAGHVESIRRAYEDIPGIEPAKEWLSILGTTTRPEHADADGQQVPLDEDFTVGGEACQHPGDARLSPAMRCNCACAIISAFVGEGLGDDEKIEEAGYNPSQPRDEQGQWSSGGGSGGGNDPVGSPPASDAAPAQESGAGERSEPKRLTSSKAITEYAKQHFPSGDKYSADEQAGIIKYAGSGYSTINNGLRRNDGDIEKVQQKKAVAALDKAMQRGAVPEDTVVYRGVKTQAMVSKLKVGDEFQDHGFVSTSLHKKVGEKFGKEAVIEITVPKGAKAIAFDSVFTGGHMGEHELLLPRGSKFKVTDVSRRKGPLEHVGGKKGKWVVKMELVTS